MDRLTAFGLFAVTAGLVCYAFEKRSHWFILGFAGACALGSLYGFLGVSSRGLAIRRGRSCLVHGGGTKMVACKSFKLIVASFEYLGRL